MGFQIICCHENKSNSSVAGTMSSFNYFFFLSLKKIEISGTIRALKLNRLSPRKKVPFKVFWSFKQLDTFYGSWAVVTRSLIIFVLRSINDNKYHINVNHSWAQSQSPNYTDSWQYTQHCVPQKLFFLRLLLRVGQKKSLKDDLFSHLHALLFLLEMMLDDKKNYY